MLFPVGDMTEDSTLLIQMLWLADNIKHLPKPYYNYYRNASSITNSLSVASCEKKFKDCCNNTNLIEEFLNEHCCTLFKEDILIKNTTREQREQIVNDALGIVDGLCDGCSQGIISMYDAYIDGLKELDEINREFNAHYEVDDKRGGNRGGCSMM